MLSPTKEVRWRRLLVGGHTRPLIASGKSPNTVVQFTMNRVLRMICRLFGKSNRVQPAMRKTRRIRGLLQFEVPSYLDGVFEVVDVWGSLCRATAPPTIVAKPAGKKGRPALVASLRVARPPGAASLGTDARKIGNDFTKALETRRQSLVTECSQ